MGTHRIGTSTALAFVLAFTVLSACKKDDDDNSSPSSGGGGGGGVTLTLSGNPGIMGSMNGTAFSYTGTGVAVGYSSETSLALAPDPSHGQYGSVLMALPATFPECEVMIGTATWYTSTSAPTDQIFQDVFHTGTRNYTADAVNGVRVRWVDADGTEWLTDSGAADQTGSTFTINEKQNTSISGQSKTKLKATFTCKVYDGAGHMRTLSNCVVVTEFAADL